MVIYPIAEGSRPDKRLTNWAVLRTRRRSIDADAAQAGFGHGPAAYEDLMPHVQRFRIPLSGRPSPDRCYHPVLGISPASTAIRSSAGGRRSRHAARRRRASDVPDGLERWLAGDPRRALPRRPAAGRPSIRCTRCAPTSKTRLPMTAEIVRINRTRRPGRRDRRGRSSARPDGFEQYRRRAQPFEQRKAIVRGDASAAGFAREQVNKAA